LNVLGLALPIVILQVYDRILPYQATHTLTLLVVGLIVVLMMDGVLRVARGAITGWNAARFEHLASCRALDRLLAEPVGKFEQVSPGTHLDRLSAINVLRDYHAGQARLLFLDFPFITLFLGLIYFIAGWLVLVPVGLFIVLGLVAGLVGIALRHALEERAGLDDRRYSFVIEALSGLFDGRRQSCGHPDQQPGTKRRLAVLQPDDGLCGRRRCRDHHGGRAQHRRPCSIDAAGRPRCSAGAARAGPLVTVPEHHDRARTRRQDFRDTGRSAASWADVRRPRRRHSP
jgi:hypothetical protein